MICDLIDERDAPPPGSKRRRDLIAFVADRPGHDLCYALDGRKLKQSWAGSRGRRLRMRCGEQSIGTSPTGPGGIPHGTQR